MYWEYLNLHRYIQGAIKSGSVEVLLPRNLLSHRKFEVKLGNNGRNILSAQSVVIGASTSPFIGWTASLSFGQKIVKTVKKEVSRLRMTSGQSHTCSYSEPWLLLPHSKFYGFFSLCSQEFRKIIASWIFPSPTFYLIMFL